MSADDTQIIRPSGFSPSPVSSTQASGLSRTSWLLIVSGALLLGIALFLFTARSITLAFTPSEAVHTLDGGFAVEIGGTYLTFPGAYRVRAEAPGYLPLETTVEVGAERNEHFALTLLEAPGAVTISSEPAGAEVMIDGASAGTTPFTAALRAGDYRLDARLARYQPYRQRITATGYATPETVTLALAPDWADVSVTSTPGGARVLLGDTDTGLTTPAVVPVPSGYAELSLKLDGYKTWSTDIEAMAEAPQSLPPVALELADGLVSVFTQPAGAGITANGRFYGESPAELALRPGERYRIRLFKAGFEAITRTITASASEQRLNVSLTPQRGDVNIVVEPADAVLYVDGRRLESANQTLSLSVAPHQIELKKDGYAGYSTRLTPKSGLTQEIKVRLLTLAEARLAALKPRRESAAGDELVLLMGGDFTLGASRREPGRRANETLREASLTRPFYMASKEVTNAQFKQFVTGHDSDKFEEHALDKPDQPVVGVTWLDAASYCNWLSKRDNLQPFYRIEPGKVSGIDAQADGYRLPTESEWAFAARTQPETDELLRFPWGPKLPPPDRHGNYADRSATHVAARVIFGYNDNHIVAAPVGTFPPNANSLHDMGGNVAEWTHDYYELPSTDAVTDHLGPATGEYHVIRGSSWRHGTISELRLSFRDYGKDGRNDVGFRIARYAE
ncbi:MAG: PEGA domain-containing protein [Pseudomonadota bacterium]